MTENIKSEPAFPCTDHDSCGNTIKENRGLSIRDFFAAKAMQGIISGITKFRDDAPEIIINRPNDVAQLAYLYADAMLEERAK